VSINIPFQYILAGLLIICSSAWAQDATLYRAQSTTLLLMLHFELYESSKGDSRYYDNLMASAKKLSMAVNDMHRPKLKQQWALTAKHLSSASVSIKRGGYLEPGKQQQFHGAIETVWADLIGEQKAFSAEQQLHLMMLQLGLRYLTNHYQLAGEFNQLPMAEMANQVGEKLQQLQAQKPSESLAKLLPRWRLLERFFKEQQNTAVPYMVTRFTLDCSQELTRRINQSGNS